MKMDVALEAVRNKIASTEAEITQAKKDGDREYLLESTKYLTKLQDEKNLLLGQKAATGMIPPYSSYQSFHIFLYIFFICLYEYFSTIVIISYSNNLFRRCRTTMGNSTTIWSITTTI